MPRLTWDPRYVALPRSRLVSRSLLLILTITASAASSEVFQPIGPWSGWVFSLTYAPTGTAAYAGLHGHVYRTTDDGNSWDWLSVDPFSPTFVALAVGAANPNLVLAGTDLYGIYRSTDGGDGWTPSIGAPEQVTDLVATPFLSFATSPAGIFRSLDAGASFALVSGLDAQAIAYQPLSGQLFVVVGNGGGVRRSDLGGETWFPASSGLETAYLQTIATHPDSAGVLYAGGSSGLFKTTNAGDSWSPVLAPPFPPTWVFDIAFDETNGARVYVATFDGGVFRSTNGGGTWEAMNAGLGDLRTRKLAAKPGASGTLLCGAGSRAIYGTTNGGLAWSEKSTGISQFFTTAIGVHGGEHLWAGGSGIFLSTDSGVHWTLSDFEVPGWSATAIAPDPNDPSLVWAAQSSGEILRSTDGGLHWVVAHNPPVGESIEDLVVDAADPRYVYAAASWSPAAEAQVVRTTDGGATWSAAPLAEVELVSALAIQPGVSTRLLVGTWEGLWESTDRGESFHPCAPDLSGFSIRDVLFSATNPNLLWAVAGGVQRSTDGGLTFTPANGSLGSDVRDLAVREIGSMRMLFATASGSGVYRSTDDGDSWTPAGSGLEMVGGTNRIAWQSAAGRLIVGTPRGLYALDFGTTAVGEEALPVASGLRIAGPWPNPLVASGDVAFELDAEQSSPITLRIYDATGRWVRGVSGRVESGGTRMRWDGRNAQGELVPSGVYFVRLSGPGRELMRKVQVVR